ncbi:unnamed protein product, partial [Eruca vesicaria subsp. sativa]|nr:unnamed protein product [Eruca vesicaria subsp. sativa]
MELKKLFMAFFITTTVVTFVYPSFGQKNIDDEPLVNPGRDMDAVKEISPASQDYNLDFLENLPTKYMMYIGTCMKTMESYFRNCNADVIEEILTKKPVSRECCMKVVKAGKKCYMEIRKVMFQFYQLKRFASQVSFRTNE